MTAATDMHARGSSDLAACRSAAEVVATVRDPELPQLTLTDLGIVRDVEDRDGVVTVTITPTYSGCPAMREITADLRAGLERAGYREIVIRTRLAPAWTTDWITEKGRAELGAAGIAPPRPARTGPQPLTLTLQAPAVDCPRCGSADTTRTAAFSGTSCKALYRCRACDEPFEAVKAL